MRKSRRLALAGLSRRRPLTGCSFLRGGNKVNQIEEVTTRILDDGNTLVTITFTGTKKDPVTFILPCGEKGKDGNGISKVEPVRDEEGNITVTITFTDSSVKPVSFVVKAGRSIIGYETEKDKETGDILLTFTYSDGTKSDPVRIPKGEKGDEGRGIKDRKCEQTENGGQKVTITFTDDTTKEFVLAPGKGISSVTSGTDENGEWVLQLYYTDGNSEIVAFSAPNTWLSGNGAPTSDSGNVGDFYFDLENLVRYQKNQSGWKVIANFKDKLSATYTVEFRTNGGQLASSAAQSKVQIERGHTFFSDNLTVPLAVKQGYTFDGWYTTKNPDPAISGRFTDLTSVYSDRTLYANWIENK